MHVRFFSLILFFLLCTFSIEARGEVILTIPKSGTHYLKLIIENLTSSIVITSDAPMLYQKRYSQLKTSQNKFVIGHCEPFMLNVVADNPKKVLLLIRDPRDIALSFVDYIDKYEPWVFPGLEKIINRESWLKLSKKEKLLMILDRSYDERQASIISFFETAINLTDSRECLIIKYEQLSPQDNTYPDLVQTVNSIATFLKVDIRNIDVQKVIEESFKNKKSATFNKGDSYRYLKEDSSIIELLNEKLSKYIDFFRF